MTTQRAFVLGGVVAIILFFCCSPSGGGSPTVGTPTPPQVPQLQRMPRPRLVYQDVSTVRIEATPVTPAQLVIADALLCVESDLVCDLAVPGYGGIDVAPVAERTVYYLYGIVDSVAGVGLIASANPPGADGPTGYSDWTYLGAFVTGPGGVIAPFVRYGNRTVGIGTDSRLLELDPAIDAVMPAATQPIPLPATTRVAALRLIARTDNSTVTGNGLLKASREEGVGGINTLAHEFHVIDGFDNRFDFDMYVEDPTSRIWVHWSVQPNPAWNAALLLRGWVEDPAQFP